MKRVLCLTMALILLLLCGCTAAPAEDPTETENVENMRDPSAPLTDGKTLKLLAITSSFGLNTTEYLYDIAMSEGFTEVIVARLYTSGCTLEKHMNFAENNTPGYQYTKRTASGWTEIKEANMRYGIMDEDWDVIFIQQSATESPLPNTYKDYVPRLIEYVRQHKPDARFVWNMTWAFDPECGRAVFNDTFAGSQELMYNALVSTVKEQIIDAKVDVDRIIPSGTAIQNARAAGSPKLTREMQNATTVDHIHLNPLGRVISGYTLFATLTDRAQLDSIKLENVPAAFHYPNDPKLEMTEEVKSLVLDAVNNALKNPYEVTK